MTSVNGSLRPPLKWAGGKRWLVPRLLKLWSAANHQRLVEPFCGGLSVALALQPSRALLNDINPALINFYQQLSMGLKIDLPLENDIDCYYRYRQEFNDLNQQQVAATRAAQLFYYLNRTGYNGLCRFNKSGGFNVPFGRYKSIHYQTDLTAYREQLSAWEFSNTDFEQLVLQPGDFVYADPPYDVPFTQYSRQGFNWQDQQRLAEWLSQHQGPVVLSNQATDRIKKLYRQLGFKLTFVDAPRSISCKGNQRVAVREVLAMRGF